MRLSSQPTPAAPGPYVSQCSERCAVCVSANRARPASSPAKRTSTQLTSPPNSQVSARWDGRSHAVITPPALPSNW